jgi:hypothetical protein
MEPGGSLPHSLKPATCPYPGLIITTKPHLFIFCLLSVDVEVHKDSDEANETQHN